MTNRKTNNELIIDIELSQDSIEEISLLAMQNGVTFNEMINIILKEYLEAK